MPYLLESFIFVSNNSVSATVAAIQLNPPLDDRPGNWKHKHAVCRASAPSTKRAVTLGCFLSACIAHSNLQETVCFHMPNLSLSRIYTPISCRQHAQQQHSRAARLSIVYDGHSKHTQNASSERWGRRSVLLKSSAAVCACSACGWGQASALAEPTRRPVAGFEPVSSPDKKMLALFDPPRDSLSDAALACGLVFVLLRGGCGLMRGPAVCATLLQSERCCSCPMRFSLLQRVAVCHSVLQCDAVCGSILQHAAVCYSVLQCFTVCRSVSQCVAVCRSVLQCDAEWCSVLQCFAVCCSVLRYAAVCCSV